MQLQLSSISLFQFKNYFHQYFSFNQRLVGICGRNGVGKTNLLDAIHYLCFTKSYFTRQDTLVTQQGHQGFRVDGHFHLHGKSEKAVCILRETGRKEFSVNDDSYTRFSAHIGRYPCVVIAPDDVQLIIGTSEDRRKFLDTLLSQLDATYLQSLINYNRLLQQRNSFLRNFETGFGGRDLSVLDVLDEQIAPEATAIFKKRSDFLLRFLPAAKVLYNDIAQRHEPVQLLYESELHGNSMDVLLQANRHKDLMLQRTTSGIHRDDLSFAMGGQLFKSIASQGQRKSLLFALKLAEVDVLQAEKKTAPVILLDDVFEKLDEERIFNLLVRVCTQTESQIFITDTSCNRLEQQFQKLGQVFQIINLTPGSAPTPHVREKEGD